MAKVKIGEHFIPTHGRPADIIAWNDMPCATRKVVYSGKPNKEHLAKLLEFTTGPVVVRNHAKSEQKSDVWLDPVGTGIRHAREWYEELGDLNNGRVYPEGINEFPIWMEGGTETQLRYELAYGAECIRLGMPSIHAEFPVGWPGNGGIADAPPNWMPWIPLLEFIRDEPNRILGLHEYWGFNKGVHFYEGWWFLRYRKVPIQVPIILTELGGLKAYENPDGTWGLNPVDGWKGDISAHDYFNQWTHAEAELLKDSNLIGATIFTTDGGVPWIGECDANPINPDWVRWAKEQPDLEPPVEPDPPYDNNIYLPVVVSPAKPTEPVMRPGADILNPLVLEAIMRVESGGEGFIGERLKIRTEAHLLLSPRYGDPQAFGSRFKAGENYSGFIWNGPEQEWIEYHSMGQAGERMAFEIAYNINPTLALMNTSMGASQIMGFNWKRVGYDSVWDMWYAFNRNENNHIIAMANYMLSEPDLVAAIASEDWPLIGRLYNGSEAAGDLYKTAYEELKESVQ